MHRVQAMHIIGFFLGPVICMISLKVEFTLGAWHVTRYNFIGLFLMTMLAICNLVVYFRASDLSSHLNSEGRHLGNERSRDSISHVNNTRDDSPSYSDETVINGIIGIILISLSSAILNYGAVISELTLPIIASVVFNWSFTRLTVVMTLCIAVFVIAYFLIGNTFKKKK